ncbi:arginine N-methyltransferase [Cryptosporidium ryanae]|uniref:arginine N-methyltransferase n=1 Tax=Cryptosporidium ryanae TaxID=515981 RepID=UPI00351A7501|nr:arginine N-methyltransferase [Cryptosporidium ryanae]
MDSGLADIVFCGGIQNELEESANGDFDSESELSGDDIVQQKGNLEDTYLDYDSYLEEFSTLSKATCLFCSYCSQLTQDIWDHMNETHLFDFKRVMSGRDEYCQIRLINYLRRCGQEGLNVYDEYKKIKDDSSIWDDDKLLVPVITDDRLILELNTIYDEYSTDDLNIKNSTISGFDQYSDDRNVVSELSLEEENEMLKQKVISLSGIISELRRNVSETPDAKNESSTNNHGPEKKKTYEDLIREQIIREDNPYFNSYSHLDIHREMILDKSRTDSYFEFITNEKNSKLFLKDKIVLDVGTGTGILSLFAVKSGAKFVVAVDAAKNTIQVAERIAQKNKLDKNIKFIHGKLEDLDLYFSNKNDNIDVVSLNKGSEAHSGLSPFKCDVIISEWMGYCLFYESMLYTILDSRDKYLKKDYDGEYTGHIFPSSVNLQLSLADYSDCIENQLNPWLNGKLYDLDLSEIAPKLHSILATPYVEIAPLERLRTTNVFNLESIPIMNVSKQELMNLRQPFTINIPENRFYTSIVVSFNATFNDNNNMSNKVVLETSPFEKPTHWKQTILHLKSPSDNCLIKAVGTLTGFISITPRTENSRHISILLELNDVKTTNDIKYPKIYNYYIMD